MIHTILGSLEDMSCKKRKREDAKEHKEYDKKDDLHKALKTVCRAIKDNLLSQEESNLLQHAFEIGKENKARYNMGTLFVGTQVKFHKKRRGWITGKIVKIKRKRIRIAVQDEKDHNIPAQDVYPIQASHLVDRAPTVASIVPIATPTIQHNISISVKIE